MPSAVSTSREGGVLILSDVDHNWPSHGVTYIPWIVKVQQRNWAGDMNIVSVCENVVRGVSIL